MRFIWTSYVAVEAETLEEANAAVEAHWEDDLSWTTLADDIEVFAPGESPIEVVESDAGPECICPADLVARGGFKGSCKAHA